MALVGKADATGEGVRPGASLVLQLSGTRGPNVWIEVLEYVRCGDENGGEHPCGVTTPDHGKAGEMARRRVIGDTGVRGSTLGGKDEVSGQMHRPTADNGSTVGGYTTTTGGLCAGNRL